MPKRTRDHQAWVIESLSNPTRAASYLNTALDDSPEMFLEALRDVAQSRQMTRVAKNAGVTRESLYKLTSVSGNPTWDSLYAVLGALDLKIEIGEKASDKSTFGSHSTGKSNVKWGESTPVERVAPAIPGAQTAAFLDYYSSAGILNLGQQPRTLSGINSTAPNDLHLDIKQGNVISMDVPNASLNAQQPNYKQVPLELLIQRENDECYGRANR